MRREAWRRRFASAPVCAPPSPTAATRPWRGWSRGQGRRRHHPEHRRPAPGLRHARRQVIELHGNASYAIAWIAAQRYEIEELRRLRSDGDVPACRACGGLVKTATISFGQAMPEAPMRRAQQETLAADLFLVLGSRWWSIRRRVSRCWRNATARASPSSTARRPGWTTSPTWSSIAASVRSWAARSAPITGLPGFEFAPLELPVQRA